MRRIYQPVIFALIAILGAGSFARLALSRGETVNAAWLLTAAVCTYAVAYRFYSKFIATKIFELNEERATPAVRLNDGRDFMPTNRWVVFGHHFAAIAGPGPLVGPTLAAQFGFLPGALWIIVGVAIGGAVQDFVILCSSVRRDGKSLGQMAKEEIGPVAGYTALVAVLGIMIVLIAVLALVVVNALKASPWGVVTIGLTIPIAMLMGVYMRWIRPHRVLEASAIGIVLLLLALFAGQWVAENPALAPIFTLKAPTDRAADHGLRLRRVGAAGVAAPRAARLSVGVRQDRRRRRARARHSHRAAAAPDAGAHPIHERHRPCVRRKGLSLRVHNDRVRSDLRDFTRSSRQERRRSSSNETDARMIGYGAMLIESLVAVMALIAACVLTPGVYFAINAPVGALGTTAATAAAGDSALGIHA